MKNSLLIFVALLISLPVRAEWVSNDEEIIVDAPYLEEELIVVSNCFGGRFRDIPIFFEEASVFFGDQMLDAMALYGILYPEECEEHGNEWYCSGSALNNVVSYRGVNAKGDKMDTGYVCNSNDDIPDNRYFNADSFEGYCVEVILYGEDEPSLYYPHDY